MKFTKLSLLFFILLALFSTTVPKTFVTPQLGERAIDLLIEIGDTLNENRSSIGEVITNATSLTITTSGNYILGENINGTIIIDSNEVWLNLNGYTVYELSGTSTGIIINQDKTNITVFNGYIKGQGSSNGIGANQGTTALKIENVTISEFEHGIYLDGTIGAEIKSCEITDCTIYNCNKGIWGNYVIKAGFENCEAKNCTETGFELRNSKYNIFKTCNAVEIENNDSEKDAVGFYDYLGDTNIFIACIAQDITKIENGYQSVGFLITGTDEVQSSGDKIINCLSNTITFSGDGFAFGILLEKILLDLQEVANEALLSTTLKTVDWDPTGQYFATGGMGTDEIRVFEFRPTELNLADRLIEVVTLDYPDQVNSVDWDHTGKYLAIGTSFSSTGTAVKIFQFKPTENSVADRLTEIAYVTHPDSIYDVDWNSTSQYLVIGGSSDNEIRVFEFKPTEAVITDRLLEITYDSSITGTLYATKWDPTGTYIATGGTEQDEVRVFEFKPTEILLADRLEEIANNNTNNIVQSVDWDPTGQYLATAGEAEIKIFEFKPTETVSANRLVEVSSVITDTTYSVHWDPSGKYIATGESSEIRVFKFMPTEMVSTNRLVEVDSIITDTTYSVGWDPSGKYLTRVGAGTDEIRVFLSFSLPENCVILNNEIGNGSGIGIEGDGINANLIAKNIGYNNPRNFTTGMFNIFSDGLNGTPSLMQNISVPNYVQYSY